MTTTTVTIQIGNSDIYLADRSIECWWPIPTETQLDNLHDYAVVCHD